MGEPRLRIVFNEESKQYCVERSWLFGWGRCLYNYGYYDFDQWPTMEAAQKQVEDIKRNCRVQSGWRVMSGEVE